MKRDHVLSVLYDLALAIGAEVRVQPLLTRVLQRLLFHTSFPVGMALLRDAPQAPAHIEVVLGSRHLQGAIGTQLTDAVWPPSTESGWVGPQTLRDIGVPAELGFGLRLVIPQRGDLLLLAPARQDNELPLEQVFAPVLRNLGQAIDLCRAHEGAARLLEQDRDQARSDLADALRQSEEQRLLMRLLTNSLPDLVWLKDRDGRYLFCNRSFERLYGTPEAGILGRTDADFVDPALAASFREHDRLAESRNAPSVNEEWLSFVADGHHGLFETTKLPVHDGRGKLLGIMGIAREITAQHQAREQLRLAASVFSHAREGILITSPDGTIIDVNDSFTRITGFTRDEAVGRTPRFLQSGRQSREFYRQMWEDLLRKGHWEGELWNRRRNGELFVEQITISAVKDPAGAVIHYVALFSDVSRMREHERQLERIAHYDVLTGLPNRVLLSDRMLQAMAQVRRNQRRLAVAYLDLDGFKEINDRHGHSVGDRFLAALAERLKQALREGDTLARIGGDEFVAVLLDLDSPQAATPVLDRLLRSAAEWIDVGGRWLRVTASVGVSFYGDGEELDADQLMRQADQAMYQAKQAGKNQWHAFDPEQDRDTRGLHESLGQIANALHGGEFELYYQPKVNLRSGDLIGVEALIRWRHPTRGLLSPAQFLPVIERHRLAVDVGEWVIDTALSQVAQWARQGLDTVVSVNISARHLQQVDFVERLDHLLATHPDVPPSRLQLEILETSALHDIAQVSRVLEACAARGVLSALDDFGTGYSSLSYLKRLPAHQLKIDQSFVRDMLDDPEDLAILEAVVGLAKAFGRQVLAEGVETVEHGVMLLQLGCDLAQGYGIAMPMPASNILEWSTHWQPDPRWLAAPTLQVLPSVILHIAAEFKALARDTLAGHVPHGQQQPTPVALQRLRERLMAARRMATEDSVEWATLGQVAALYDDWVQRTTDSVPDDPDAAQAVPDAVAMPLRQLARDILQTLGRLIPGGFVP